jgi:D-alanine-D-alanine ligase
VRIGLAYDLAADWAAEDLDAEATAEFDQIETIEAIAALLASQGHEVVRIGRAEQLVQQLARGTRWDLVFNICEGLWGIGREALVPALLDAYRVPYVFSDPEVLALCLHKAHCKRVVRDAGLPTADFRVLEHPEQDCDLGWPMFVKPLAEGTGKGIGEASLCCTAEQLAGAVRRIIDRFGQPALAEAWLPGREFTVGIIGTGATAEILGVMEIRSPATYGFKTKKSYESVTYDLAADAEGRAAGQAALAAWRVLGGRDAGRIDLRGDAQARPMFLEANPLAGLHPVDSDLTILARLSGHDHGWLLTRIMDAACARLGLMWR